MVVVRALIYSIAVFVALGIIALIVAGIMRIIYSIVHRGEKKIKEESPAVPKPASE